MKKIAAYTILMMAAAGCTAPGIPEASPAGSTPEIYPDYTDATLPPNLVPVRFRPAAPAAGVRAVFEGSGHRVVVDGSDGSIAIRPSDWASVARPGSTVDVTLYTLAADGWKRYDPFHLHISTETIDPYIAYRKIEPGYETWNEMGIYQRCLETFDETPVVTNRQSGYGCINCHSFCANDPATMLLHMRVDCAGTYVLRDGEIEKLSTAIPSTISALVYPSWHPGGRYVAFSTNTTSQMFHTSHPNRIEVMDQASDVVVYDTERKEILMNPLLGSPAAFETFPAFSPDGRTLYFCTADTVAIPESYDKVRYRLCSIAFDPQTRTFGERVDTLFDAAAAGKSASFPRVSPDGRHLMFVLSDYGNFSIWHREADLYMATLPEGRVRRLDALCSPEAESYHSWSSNGRWVVFASRRLDGLYTRPYLAYIGPDGEPSKPVPVPQEDADHYTMEMKSYNVPEFIKGPVATSRGDWFRAVRSEAAPVKAVR